MKVIEIIFGLTFANKLRLKIGETKRNPLIQTVVSLKDSFIEKYENATDGIKALYIIWLCLNLFIFSGIIPFVLVVVMDYRLIKHLSKGV